MKKDEFMKLVQSILRHHGKDIQTIAVTDKFYDAVINDGTHPRRVYGIPFCIIENGKLTTLKLSTGKEEKVDYKFIGMRVKMQ